MEDVKNMIDRIKAMDEQPQEKPQPADDKVDQAKDGKSFMDKIRGGGLTQEDIPEGVRQEWVRSILGGSPFAYSVPILGGKVSFVFGELDKEGAAIHRSLAKSLGSADLDRQTKLCIILFLKEISGEVNVKFEKSRILGDPNASMFTEGKVDKAYDELCDKMPVGLTRLLVGAWSIYSTLVAFLTENAFPDSF